MASFKIQGNFYPANKAVELLIKNYEKPGYSFLKSTRISRYLLLGKQNIIGCYSREWIKLFSHRPLLAGLLIGLTREVLRPLRLSQVAAGGGTGFCHQ